MNSAKPDQIRRLHAMLGERNMMHRKKDLVVSASQGRTESSKGLSEREMDLLISRLETIKPVKQPERDPILDKKRKRVIANMAAAGYVLESGKPDMIAIYAWVRRQKHKKELNQLSSQDLSELIVAAEGVAKHFIRKAGRES